MWPCRRSRAQPAAHIDVSSPAPAALQLGVDMGQLVDGLLDAADVLQLAARVAVDQLEAVFHACARSRGQQVQYLGDEQADFDFSPAESRQRPEPSLASLTRTAERGRTP